MKSTIDGIQVSGFKSIRQADLKLNALNVLIGPNGVGKSNFIGLFRLINYMIEGRLQVYAGLSGGAGELLHFGRKHTPKMEFEFTFSDAVNGYSCTLLGTDDDGLLFLDESIWFHNKAQYEQPYKYNLAAGHRETRLGGGNHPPKGVEAYVVAAMKSWRIYHFHDTSAGAKVKQPCELHDNRVLKGDASNLAAFLYLLRANFRAHYNNILDAVRMVAPFFQDFVLEPLALNQQMIRLEWTEKGNDHVFGPGALSDGTLRFICLATLLLQPQLPSTILLDEPELGLHPYAITLLAELLRSSSTKTQVIASTQSVSLVNQFEPQDILVVEREGGESVFKRLQKGAMDTWIEDYGLGDLWEKNLLGGRP